MTEYLIYNDPLHIIWRKGTAEDPYSNITESWKVAHNKVALTEIPDEFNHVVIVGYTEVRGQDVEIPSSTQFVVNYQNGIVTFNSSENGKTVSVNYRGRGVIMYPASRIYVDTDLPNVYKNLQEIVDNVDDALEAIGDLDEVVKEAKVLAVRLETDITTGNTLKTGLANSIATVDAKKSELDLSIANSVTSIVALDESIASSTVAKTALDTSNATAAATKTALDTANTAANATKIALDTSNTAAATLKTDLDSRIITATTKKTDLDGSISSATTKKNELDGSISTAATSKTNLDASNATASTTKTNLDASNTTANETKSSLDTSIATGNILKADLDANILTGSTLKTNLDASISSAASKKTDLDASIGNATTGKTLLDESISTADTSKTALDGSIIASGASKTKLDASIAFSEMSKAALDGSRSLGDTLKGELDSRITTGNALNGSLDINISSATTINTTLGGTITAGQNKIEQMDAKLTEATTAISNTNSAISNANSVSDRISVFETFNPSKIYYPLNKVSYGGSSYVCTTQTTAGILPSNASYWTLIAQAGNGNVSSVNGDASGDFIVANPTSNVTLSLNTGIGANKIVKLDATGKVTADILINGTNNVVVSAAEKTTWNTKSVVSNPVISMGGRPNRLSFSIDINGKTTTTTTDLIDATMSNHGLMSSTDKVNLDRIITNAMLSDADASTTGSITVSGGALTLNNATSNFMSFGAVGLSTPNESGNSLGTKINLFNNGASYAIGVEIGSVWYSSQGSHKWYTQGGTSGSIPSISMTLDEAENLTVTGDIIGTNKIKFGGDGGKCTGQLTTSFADLSLEAMTDNTSVYIRPTGNGTLFLNPLLDTAVSTKHNVLDDGRGNMTLSGGLNALESIVLISDTSSISFMKSDFTTKLNAIKLGAEDKILVGEPTTQVVFYGAGTPQYNDGTSTYNMYTTKNLNVSDLVKGNMRISAGTTAPFNPNVNDIWYDTSSETVSKRWTGTQWEVVGGSGGSRNVVASTTAPVNPPTGSIWIELN